MFQRVVSNPDGTVIFFYNSKKVTVPRSGVPKTDIAVYNKKEVDELFRNLHFSSYSIRDDKLFHVVQARY